MKTDVCTEVEKSLRKEWEEMQEREGRRGEVKDEGVEDGGVGGAERQGERVKVLFFTAHFHECF